MKPRVLTVPLLVLALAVGAFPHDPKPRGQVVQITIHSAALEHNRVKDSPDRAVSIYLPPDYDSETRRFSVLYLLHGYTGTERGWMNPSYVGLPEMMDRLLRHHAIQPMIVIMPNCFNRFDGSFYTNSVLSGDWEDFIVRDLVSYVDAHYRTIVSPEGRGIAGHSMGGYGALRLGMDHPEVFSVAYGLALAAAIGTSRQVGPTSYAPNIPKLSRRSSRRAWARRLSWRWRRHSLLIWPIPPSEWTGLWILKARW